MLYLGRDILLVSKHQKEVAIRPHFEKQLSCRLSVSDFDTDRFGTFTGEIERSLPAYESCLIKAKTGAEAADSVLALASEGSFGPHPFFPFMPCDQEWMLFLDREKAWVIAESLLSADTNYQMLTIQKETPIEPLLNDLRFPSHALVLQSATDKRTLAKGVQDRAQLEAALNEGFRREKHLILSTDMRAMMNPTRMKLIAQLAEKLVKKIASLCPQCQRPGFGLKKTQGHLCCKDCGFPTRFYQEEVWVCEGCVYQENKARQDGLSNVEPTFCTYCNP